MNREEAQNILQLCRPDHIEDRKDPLIAEALELLNQDAELRIWFEEQQALDAEISAELNRIQPPSDLKTCILVGMRAHAAQSELLKGEFVEEETNFDHTIPFPNPLNRTDHRSWLRPFISIAAIFVVAGIILVLPRNQEPAQLANSDALNTVPSVEPLVATASVPNIIEFLAKQISEFNGSKFDKRSEQINELQSHLASTGMPTPASIPKKIEALPSIGCVTFDYNGTKLSMICFKNDKVYHLITANKADFPKDCAPHCDKAAPKFFESQKQAFKIWSKGDQVFILTTKGTEEDIPEFI